jgi:hypothetical protein
MTASDFKTHARDRAEDAVTGLETGELPDMNGIDIAGSHGAITSLYAGAAPDAGDFNGGVCSPASSTASKCRLTSYTVFHCLGTPHASTPEGS